MLKAASLDSKGSSVAADPQKQPEQQMSAVLSEPCCDENRQNRLNSQTRSIPVIADGQPKLYPSRVARLFSAQTRCEESSLLRGPAVTPHAWSGLAGYRVMGSFKKLRTSVLQGIQSRSSAMAANQEPNLSAMTEDVRGFFMTKRVTHQSTETNQFSKGASQTERKYSMSDDCEDFDDEEQGFQRNSHFSQSIRKAYGAGRISLLDVIKPESGVESVPPSKCVEPQENVIVLRGLSKSVDNLSSLKSHFRQKAAPVELKNPESSVQFTRAASSSSVDLPDQGSCRRQSSSPARGHLQKLVGSLTDLSVKHKNTRRIPLSPLSQLHDDYSRRIPCLPISGRQRRPSPTHPHTGTSAHHSHQHVPTLHPAPSCPVVFCSGLDDPLDPPRKASALLQDYERLVVSSADLFSSEPPLCLLKGFSEPMDWEQDGMNEKQSVNGVSVSLKCLWSPAEKEPEDLETPSEDLKELCTSPATESPLASPISDISPAVVPRRRAGRLRPRPVSDYSQLERSKCCIPEEDKEPENIVQTAQKRSHGNDRDSENHKPGNGHVFKQRPISVIGGVDLFSSPAAEQKDDAESLPSPVSRPPVPSHRVPPYRAVSARLRPCIFSQSTPIGLDRMGRRRGRRVLSEESSDLMLDDSVSEEDGSFEELTEGTPYLKPQVDLFILNQYIHSGRAVYAEALWDHVTMEEQELAFKAGDVIRVLDVQEKDWWWGLVGDHEAWFPSSFVRVRVNQEYCSSENVEMVVDEEESVLSDTHKQSSEHREQMRANVVREIMDTERVYMKHLKDICEGYIRQCRKHPGMFTEAQLKTIFSNIEDIYRFHRTFLKDLEKKYISPNPHLSEIGSCFLQQGEGFSIYSDYCNTHPVACAELQRLMKQGKYKHFFEACRLLQQMIDISIAGFLLTPVQKICKYPLQLGELLKYTPKDHSDYGAVCDAHKAMKNVASLINERKRRLESIDTIAHWQVSILHWTGDDVLTRSSELIHSGELTRVLRPGKTQQRSYFLFDHQLVFCKKDVLRRDLLHYRGRLDTDHVELVDLCDGRHADSGFLKNAFLLRHRDNLNVLCVLCCKKSQDKQRWMQAFDRERRRVQEDQEMGMEITESQRKQAMFNARKAKQGKMKKSYSGHPVSPLHHQQLHPLHQRHVTVPTSVPQQQVFSLAEPKKTSQLWYSFARSALFRK